MIAGIVAGAPVAGGGGGTDPYIAFRKTIANLDADLSDPYRTWTANGGAAVTGGWLVLDGSGDYLSAPAGSFPGLGSGDFCVESFIDLNSYNPGASMIVGQWGGSSFSWLFGVDGSGFAGIYVYASGSFPSRFGSVAVGLSPVHVAVYTQGSQSFVSVGGVPQEVSPIPVPDASAGVLTIGAQSDGVASALDGGVNGVRVTVGSSGGYGAGSFTPPSFPLPTS